MSAETATSSITDIIAIIGCITGCASLIISFYRAKFESGRLTVRTSKFHNLFFDKLPESRNLTKYQAIIWLEIVNDAPHPTTIYDIDIKLSDGHYSPDKCPVSEIVFETNVKDGISTKITENMVDHVTLPLTIQPFNVYQGFVFLGFFIDEPKNTEHFFMKIRATQKDKFLYGRIHKWN